MSDDEELDVEYIEEALDIVDCLGERNERKEGINGYIRGDGVGDWFKHKKYEIDKVMEGFEED